jgi:hypothetical protein
MPALTQPKPLVRFAVSGGGEGATDRQNALADSPGAMVAFPLNTARTAGEHLAARLCLLRPWKTLPGIFRVPLPLFANANPMRFQCETKEGGTK